MGRRLSDDTRKKMSEARLRWLEDPENRRKEIQFKLRGERHPRGMKGKHHSTATIQRFKETRLGNPGNRKGPWNKGLTRRTDERVLKQAIEMQKARWGGPQQKEEDKK
jgi:hypothetical protein